MSKSSNDKEREKQLEQIDRRYDRRSGISYLASIGSALAGIAIFGAPYVSDLRDAMDGQPMAYRAESIERQLAWPCALTWGTFLGAVGFNVLNERQRRGEKSLLGNIVKNTYS